MKKYILSLFFLFLFSCSSITTKDKIEAMFMPDFRQWQQEGEEKASDFIIMNKEVEKVISSHNFGGVILFANNLKNSEQSYKLIEDIQKSSKVPMFIATDQEGGIVARLNSGTRFPGNMALGTLNNELETFTVGKYIAEELMALGINTNFSPVADVNSNPNNPVIGLRSFSSDKELVAKHSLAMMLGMQDENLITTAKHFPGHGDTDIDTHLGLASIDKTKEELYELEFYPFINLINNGVDMIMSAHVALPKIENEKIISKVDGSEISLPATLSKKVLTDILRNELNFKGVIVTDALTGMKAITDNMNEYEATKKAILAGADILLMPVNIKTLNDVNKLDNIIHKLVEDVKNGVISEDRINESYERIMKLKEKRNILNNSNDKLELGIIGSKNHKDFEREISKKSISMIKFTPYKNINKILIVTTSNSQNKVSEFAIERLKKESKLDNNIVYDFFVYNKDTKEEEIKKASVGYDIIIVYGAMNNASALNSENYRTKIPNIIGEIENIHKIFVSINKPYDAVLHLNYDTVLISYGYSGADPTEKNIENTAYGPNIPASLEVIFENKKIPLKLPVDLPEINNGIIQKEIKFERNNK